MRERKRKEKWGKGIGRLVGVYLCMRNVHFTLSIRRRYFAGSRRMRADTHYAKSRAPPGAVSERPDFLARGIPMVREG